MPQSINDVVGAALCELKPSSPFIVTLDESLARCVAMMQEHRIGCLLVTEDEHLVGIMSERDILIKVVGQGLDLKRVPVQAVMTWDPEVLHLNDSIAFAMNRMNLGGYRHVPLVDDAGRPTGMVSVKDVMNYLVDHFPDAVLNLPPEPRVYSEAREGA